MKNYIKKWLGIFVLEDHAKLHGDVTVAQEEKIRVIESVIGAKALEFHRRSLKRGKAQRYDEVERARKIKRKG